jgi:oligoribonuclease NrnB/cAMP/cGMP phosphodiesterase (DHH superfamily)
MRAAPLIIYHANCYDGFTAAWVFSKFYAKRRTIIDPEPEYYGAHYGEEPPDCSGREVYILDFSYPRDIMIDKVILPSSRTFVFDHHKTAQEDLQDLVGEIRRRYGINRVGDKIVFDMARSGAGITFDELSRDAGHRAGVHAPTAGGRGLWIVDYVEDRDLWRKALPRTDAFTAYMATKPMTFEEWDKMQASTLKDLADQGEAVLSYIEQYGNKATAQARVETIAGYKAYTMNLPYMNCSEFLNKLLTDPNEMKVKPDFAASYFRTLKGEWQFSLRSVGDFDVSRVAQAFGGGGHKSAAGFKVSVLPWEVVAPTFVSDIKLEEIGDLGPGSLIPVPAGHLPMVATPDGDDAAVKLGESSE